MKRALASISILAATLLWAASPAGAAFGLKNLDVTFSGEDGKALTQAGAHPFALTTKLSTVTRPEPALPEIGEVTEGAVKDLTIAQIVGLAGNPTAVSPCSTLDFLAFGSPDCSRGTALGVVETTIGDPHTVSKSLVYNLTPPPGGVFKLGFVAAAVRVTVEVKVKPTPPYNPVAVLSNIPNLVQFYSSKLTLWGVPAAKSHDTERGGPAGVAEKPFLTVPRACEGPLETLFEATSWQGDVFSQGILTHNESEPPVPQGFTDCARLGFSPQAAAKPSTDQASSPSGLDFDLDVEDPGLANPSPEAVAASDIKKATLTLPEGVTLNPSVAEGLAVCSEADLARETLGSEPGQGCPEASKVGTVEAETPLLEDQLLKGSLFVATQNENPFHSLIALYMVVKDPELGILVKLAGKVTPNPHTGQIETTFGEPGQELPQFPLSHVRVHLREGGRSPLITPPTCGTYTTEATFTPWADPANPLTVPSSFQITRGVGGGPCPPPGPPPFAPGFEAGTLGSQAGSFSPFVADITRRDGDQDLTRFSFTLPPGLLGRLAGISQCPEAAIAAARAKSGRQEQASPSCPQSSAIGHVLGGAGVGSQLTYVPGRLYLAGPFGGDPLSAVAIVPAVAGPFDVGNVVVRVALRLNPVTAQVEVDSSHSEPIPHMLAGIPLSVREVRVAADHPDFTLNPTDCDPFAVRGQLWGGGANPFSAADDSPVARESRFRAVNCARLGFRPELSLRLKGGTRRGAHPALRSIVTPRPGDANFSRVVVTLPRSAFLDQAHIRTICTRVQFAAGVGNGQSCPPGSVYGHATAWTPLLDEPAEGPVYLRSSNHNLPDLVMALKGPPSAAVEVELAGRIDSHKGGIRASFESVPDVPVSRFVLEMQGGAKGLIVNSRNLCARASKASGKLRGQNGRRQSISPLVRPAGCGHGHRRRGKRRS